MPKHMEALASKCFQLNNHRDKSKFGIGVEAIPNPREVYLTARVSRTQEQCTHALDVEAHGA